MSTFLVTGASRGYGCAISYTLQGMKHAVYTAQRTPPPSSNETDRARVLKHWKSCDFSEPSDPVATVNELMTDKVTLDGMVHAVSRNDKINPGILNAYHLGEHSMVNVFGPLMFTLYLSQYHVLKPNARVIFLLDQRKLKADHIAYVMSKGAIPAMTKILFSRFSDCALKLLFAVLPVKDDKGEDDHVSHQIANLLTMDAEFLDKDVYDFRRNL